MRQGVPPESAEEYLLRVRFGGRACESFRNKLYILQVGIGISNHIKKEGIPSPLQETGLCDFVILCGKLLRKLTV